MSVFITEAIARDDNSFGKARVIESFEQQLRQTFAIPALPVCTQGPSQGTCMPGMLYNDNSICAWNERLPLSYFSLNVLKHSAVPYHCNTVLLKLSDGSG